jgi:hypothetical protein
MPNITRLDDFILSKHALLAKASTIVRATSFINQFAFFMLRVFMWVNVNNNVVACQYFPQQKMIQNLDLLMQLKIMRPQANMIQPIVIEF